MRPLLLASLACAALLSACGGGGDPSSSDTSPAPGTLQPASVETTIVTPSVSGLRTISCGNGATCRDELSDSSGKFTMVINGTLTLGVGPLTILSAHDTSKPVTSILAFSATGDETDVEFINRMTLLYSLDKDGDPTNGISIAQDAHTAILKAPYQSVNFAVSASEFVSNPAVQAVVNAVNAVQKSPGVSLSLRDPAQVQETVKQLLFKEKWGGTWTITLDNSATDTVTLKVSADGTVSVANSTVTFPLALAGKSSANLRFTDSTQGSFIGALSADGTGKGTWSKLGTSPTAGFWTAKKTSTSTSATTGS